MFNVKNRSIEWNVWAEPHEVRFHVENSLVDFYQRLCNLPNGFTSERYDVFSANESKRQRES